MQRTTVEASSSAPFKGAWLGVDGGGCSQPQCLGVLAERWGRALLIAVTGLAPGGQPRI